MNHRREIGALHVFLAPASGEIPGSRCIECFDPIHNFHPGEV